jgi:hypothetical protein
MAGRGGARFGEVRQGKGSGTGRHSGSSPGTARVARRERARRGRAGRGAARPGRAGRGEAREVARMVASAVRLRWRARTWHGRERRGMARHGRAWQGRTRQGPNSGGPVRTHRATRTPEERTLNAHTHRSRKHQPRPGRYSTAPGTAALQRNLVGGLVRRGRVPRLGCRLGRRCVGGVVAVTVRLRETRHRDDRDGTGCALATVVLLAFPAVLLAYRTVEWVVV